MLLLKVKLIPKYESKLYSYNKVKVHQYKILNYYSYHYYIIIYINTIHNKCHCVFMYDERDKNTNSYINSLIKYIYQTHMEVWCKMKSIATIL